MANALEILLKNPVLQLVRVCGHHKELSLGVVASVRRDDKEEDAVPVAPHQILNTGPQVSKKKSPQENLTLSFTWM